MFKQKYLELKPWKYSEYNELHGWIVQKMEAAASFEQLGTSQEVLIRSLIIYVLISRAPFPDKKELYWKYVSKNPLNQEIFLAETLFLFENQSNLSDLIWVDLFSLLEISIKNICKIPSFQSLWESFLATLPLYSFSDEEYQRIIKVFDFFNFDNKILERLSIL